MKKRQMLVFSLVTSLLTLGVSPRASLAQLEDHSHFRNSLTLLGGAFIYDYGNDARSPFVSASLGRSVSRFVELEGTVSYARMTTRLYSLTPTITPYDVRTPFLAADLGVNLLLPLGRFVPYVGGSMGAFRRNAGNDAANTVSLGGTSGTSVGAALGARVLFTPRVGVRGEFRYRADGHKGFDSPANDVVMSGGLIYRF